MESAGPGTVTYDGAGKIVGWNRAAERILGYTRQEVLGSSIRALAPAGSGAPGGAPDVEVVADAVLLHKDGRHIAVRTSRTLLEGVACTVQLFWLERGAASGDGSAPEPRAAPLERLALALAAARVGTFVVDCVGDVVTWDESARELWGRAKDAPSEGRRSTLPTYIHEDDVAEVTARRRACFESGASELLVDFRIRRPDGEIRWISTRGRVERDAGGEPIRVSGVCLDVTDQKNAESALRARDEEFRQLATSIREVFWLTDVDKGQIVYVSPAYDEIWGRSPERLYTAPRDWLDAVHPDDRDRVLAAALTKQALGTYDEEYRIVRPDGTTRWIRDRAFPVRDDRGEIIRVAGVAEDVTARRDLEHQLRETQKMESLGLLAGGVAHDFNNLLTIVMACTEELLRATAADDPNRELLVEAASAVERAASLTRDLLAFGRRQIHEPRVLDLNGVVADAERMLARLLGEDVVLHTALAAEVLPVMVDPGQMASVLMNLAVNSRHAMPRGGTLVIRTRVARTEGAQPPRLPAIPAGRYAILEVEDTGLGFDDAVASRIFEPFFTTKAPGKGTGLGLAVVRSVVQQSGGFLDVSSEPRVGTTFRIYLPVLDEPPVSFPERSHAELAGNETVLLVEDEAAVLATATRSLEASGFNVLAASSAEEALETLGARGGAVDIVVTDVVLPRMDGKSLVALVGERYPKVKALFTSGYAPEHFDKYGVSLAADAFLAKPFTPRRLVSKMREVLDGGPRRATDPPSERPLNAAVD